jgi:uncharacterized delta-60 repeat protein
VLRLEADGTPDATFGSGGVVQTNLPQSTTDAFTDILVQPDGKIVCGGFNDGGLPDFDVVRYLSDGSLDTTFNGTGIQSFSFGTGFGGPEFGQALALQPDGNVLIAGFGDDDLTAAPDDALLARLLGTDGSFDATLGAGGKLGFDFGDDEECHAMALDPLGPIVLAGQAGTSGVGDGLDVLLIRVR